MSDRSFGTAINCIDGRAQCPVKHWMKENLGVDYVDVITEPGADKAMAEGNLMLTESIRQKVLISVNVHQSRAVAVVAHHDCAGNPVGREEHIKMLQRGVDRVIGWRLADEVLGLWVDDQGQVEPVVRKPGR